MVVAAALSVRCRVEDGQFVAEGGGVTVHDRRSYEHALCALAALLGVRVGDFDPIVLPTREDALALTLVTLDAEAVVHEADCATGRGEECNCTPVVAVRDPEVSA